MMRRPSQGTRRPAGVRSCVTRPCARNWKGVAKNSWLNSFRLVLARKTFLYEDLLSQKFSLCRTRARQQFRVPSQPWKNEKLTSESGTGSLNHSVGPGWERRSLQYGVSRVLELSALCPCPKMCLREVPRSQSHHQPLHPPPTLLHLRTPSHGRPPLPAGRSTGLPGSRGGLHEGQEQVRPAPWCWPPRWKFWRARQKVVVSWGSDVWLGRWIGWRISMLVHHIFSFLKVSARAQVAGWLAPSSGVIAFERVPWGEANLTLVAERRCVHLRLREEGLPLHVVLRGLGYRERVFRDSTGERYAPQLGPNR